jgi:hypothetical protein
MPKITVWEDRVGSFSVWHWLIVLIMLAFELVWVLPLWRILGRVGHPRGLALLGLIPGVALILVWWIAYSRWPSDAGPNPAIFA